VRVRIGAQVPVAGGLLASLPYAVETGCETVQIFAKSPRRWFAPPLEPSVASAFAQAYTAAGIGPVFVHGSYLINLGANDPEQWERSWLSLTDELLRAEALGAGGLVMHLGRRYSDDDAECVARIAETVLKAYETAQGPAVTLLLENTAGAGRQYGVDARELSAVVNVLREAGVPTRLCIDTCHALAAGIDLRGPDGWEALLDELDEKCGPQAIALVHANDSKGALGSHRDRHEWIGDGEVGEAGFAAMFSCERLRDAAAVVEMSGDKPLKDLENVSRLKRLRDGVAASASPSRAPA
jgi:deoxyribonuclease-4